MALSRIRRMGRIGVVCVLLAGEFDGSAQAALHQTTLLKAPAH